MGRRTKLTPEVQRKIAEAVGRGSPYYLAAQEAGVAPETISRWLRLGEESSAKAAFRAFHAAVKQAEARFVNEAVKEIGKAGKKEWRALGWLLERRFPDEFGRRDAIDTTTDEVDPAEDYL